MKRKRFWLLPLIVVLLLSVVTPAFADLPPPPPPPPPPPTPPPGGGGNLYDCYVDKFLVEMFYFGQHKGYNWVEKPGWRCGRTLAEPVSIVGTYHTAWGPRGTYKLEIPMGTVIESYYYGYKKAYLLQFRIMGGEYYFPQNLKFSQPVTLSEWINDEWVVRAIFNQTVQGKASLK